MGPLTENDSILQRFRDVEKRSHEMTDNSLTFDRSPTELAGALRRVTKLEDKEIDGIQRIVDERAARGEITGIACAKGCWFCCTQMVAVTIPEVLRLAEHIATEWTAEQREALDERMASYMKATEAYREGRTRVPPRHVCPLLQDAACSVWLVRPIICRAFNSTDVNACIRRKENPQEEEIPVPSITGQLQVGMAGRTGMRHALAKHNLDNSLYEMIPALIIALTTPQAGERYFAGEPIFAGALAKNVTLD